MGGMIESVVVARVEDGMIVESEVFAGTDPATQNRLAEELFASLCQKHVPAWGHYDAKSKDAALEDGCEEYGKGSIQITHPEGTLICPSAGIPKPEPDGPETVKKGTIFLIAPSDSDGTFQACIATADGNLYDLLPASSYHCLSIGASLRKVWRLAKNEASKLQMAPVHFPVLTVGGSMSLIWADTGKPVGQEAGKKGKPKGANVVRSGDIFIVTPGTDDRDELHRVCQVAEGGDLQLDIYPNDKYLEIGARMSLKAAKAVAKRNGCKNPKVI